MGVVSLWFGLVIAMLSCHSAVLAQSEQADSGDVSAAEMAPSVSQASGEDASLASTDVGGETPNGETELGEATEPVTAMGLMGQFFSNPLNLILISAILFMFIVVRPQQQAARQAQAALAALKKNDRIITASGIHGTVVQAGGGDPTIVIRIDENTGTKITVNRDSVSKVVTPDDAKK